MTISKSFIATAVIAVLPLVAFGGDKDKTMAPTGTAASAQFDTLDANRDGRLSREEAATDAKIVFSTADKNGDGYLDNSEYSHRDMSNGSMPTHPATDPTLAQVSSRKLDAPARPCGWAFDWGNACGNALKLQSRTTMDR
jgi:hypothetical protein